MKPVVLSLAAAVLLLISLTNHRQESCTDKGLAAPIHNCAESQTKSDFTKSVDSVTENIPEPVSFSGKYINYFVSF